MQPQTDPVSSTDTPRGPIYSLPPELLAHVFHCLLEPPVPPRNLDSSHIDPPFGFPTEAEIIRRSLSASCLVSKDFNEQAKPSLWSDISVASGRGWMAVVNTLMEEVTVVQQPLEAEAYVPPSLGGGSSSSGGLGIGVPGPSSHPAGIPHQMDQQRGRELGPAASSIDHQHVSNSFAPDELTFSTAPPPDPLLYHESEEDGEDHGIVEPPLSSPSIGSSLSQPLSSREPAAVASLVEPPTTSAQSPYSLPGFTTSRWQVRPWLPALLTPPTSRHQSPVRLRSRSSRSRSRSRSLSGMTKSTATAAPGAGLERSNSLRGTSTLALDSDGKKSSRSRSRAREEPYLETISGRLASVTETLWGDSFNDTGKGKAPASESSGMASPLYHDVEHSSDAGRGRSRVRSPASAERQLSPSPEEPRAGMDWTFDGSGMWDENSIVETPGKYIQTLSFANFRTTGTYRTLEEAIRGKFVTSGRLEGVLKNTSKLRRIAFTEYVDSSLTLPIITELFFRGYPKPSSRFNSNVLQVVPSRTGSLPEYAPYEPESEEEEWDRRRDCAKLEALDLTGCVSGVFGEGLEKFVAGWLEEPEEGYSAVRDLMQVDPQPAAPIEGATGSRRRSSVAFRGGQGALSPGDWIQPRFDGLERLSLRGCVTLSSTTIASLLACLPRLTHLDLSFTRVAPNALAALAEFPDMRLVSLSLARSSRLPSDSIRDFLVDAPAASSLVDLNLFGDQTYSSPLTSEDLTDIIKRAPCFTSGQLRYLDLSSSPVTAAMLGTGVFPPQPCLRSLGLSYIPDLSLDPLAAFLRELAPNVEVLALTSSATRTDLGLGQSAINTTMALHSKLVNPLAMPKFSVYGAPPDAPTATRLRVIELNTSVRRALGPSGGSANWKSIKSKGGRGWYVDVSTGWKETVNVHTGQYDLRFQRGIDRNDPWCQYLALLVKADGKVASNVGWHSRKMEVLKGAGMMGREEGLYGAGAFAFEG